MSSIVFRLCRRAWKSLATPVATPAARSRRRHVEQYVARELLCSRASIDPVRSPGGGAVERGRVWLVLLARFERANPFGYAILNRARFPVSPQEQEIGRAHV